MKLWFKSALLQITIVLILKRMVVSKLWWENSFYLDFWRSRNAYWAQTCKEVDLLDSIFSVHSTILGWCVFTGRDRDKQKMGCKELYEGVHIAPRQRQRPMPLDSVPNSIGLGLSSVSVNSPLKRPVQGCEYPCSELISFYKESGFLLISFFARKSLFFWETAQLSCSKVNNFTKELFLFKGQNKLQHWVEKQKMKSCLLQVISLSGT